MPYTINTAKATILDGLGNPHKIDVFSGEVEDARQEALAAVEAAKTSAVSAVDAASNRATRLNNDTTATLDETANMIAEDFVETNAYKAGTYVRKEVTSGSTTVVKLYRLTADYTANAGWDSANKVEVKLGNDVIDLKSAISNDREIVSSIMQNYNQNLFNPFWMNVPGILFDGTEIYGKSGDFVNIPKLPINVPGGENGAVTITFEAYVEPLQASTGNGVVFSLKRQDGTTSAVILPIPNDTSEWTRFSATANRWNGVNGIILGCSSAVNNITHIRNIQIENNKSATDYVYPITARDKKAEMREEEIEDKITVTNNVIKTLRKDTTGVDDGISYEFGTIIFSNSGFTYQNSTNTIRILENETVNLVAGDKIGLTSYTNAEYYVGWIDSNGAYYYVSGWQQADYTVAKPGNYKMIVRHIDKSVPATVGELSSLVNILKLDSFSGNINLNTNGIIVATSNYHDVSHRGLRAYAPENTKSAFKASKKNGFIYVESDVWPTSDGNFVMLHDSTVDRTSNGTGTVYNMTLAQLQALDFGSWFSPAFANTKILTFTEFILLCKNLGLKPYIELKHDNSGFTAWTQEQINQLVNTVKSYNMENVVTWVDYSYANLSLVTTAYNKSRVGVFLESDINQSAITVLDSLKNTTSGEVFAFPNYTLLTSEGINLAMQSGYPIEVYSCSTSSAILASNKYISGYLAEAIIPSVVLCQES